MPNGREFLLSLTIPEEIREFTEFYQSPARELQSLYEIRNSEAILAEAMLLSEDGETTPMASVHARNTSVKVAPKPNFEKISAETLLIKDATDINAIDQAFMNNGMGNRAFFFSNIFNNFQRRIDAVRDRRYALATEPLSTGNFTIKENNVDLTVNIGFKPENLMFSDWTSSTADIIGDITRLMAVSRKRQTPITRSITSTKVGMNILQNEGVQALYKQVTFGAGIPTGFSTAVGTEAFASILNAVMRRLFGIAVVLNDEWLPMMNADGTISEYRVYDENKITFFGGALDSRLGIVLAGLTEEELMWREEVELRRTVRSSDGIVTYRWDSDNPPRRMLQAATVALPLYPNIKNMYIMTVLE